MRQAPPPASIRKAISYNPETGVFTREVHRARSLVGKQADHVSNCGYRSVQYLETLYLAHRLAWWFMHSEWPPEQVDHINLNKLDNRMVNLRLATRSQNAVNSPKRGSLRLKGVTFNKDCNKYQSQIKKDGVSKYLGLFQTEQEAHAAYAVAAIAIHGEFARLA